MCWFTSIAFINGVIVSPAIIAVRHGTVASNVTDLTTFRASWLCEIAHASGVTICEAVVAMTRECTAPPSIIIITITIIIAARRVWSIIAAIATAIVICTR